jgi:predicted P-loop ATPase
VDKGDRGVTDPIDLDAARKKKKGRPPHEIPKTDWGSELRCDQDGRVTPDVGNATIILANAAQWAGCLTYDDFADRICWTKDAPSIHGMERPLAGQEVADHHATFVHHWFARRKGITLKKGAVQDAMVSAARLRTVHPLRAYLAGLKWDGQKRLSLWLTAYLGTPACRYSSAVGRWWMISAIARVMRPGCQADHMLVLEGAQGLGKSSALRILAGDFYLPSLPDIKNPAGGHMLQGNWIAEVGELDALRRQELTTVKDFITRTVDKYRPPYGRFQVTRPRQMVFAATTNEEAYLHDASGGRRFWPVVTHKLEREMLIRDRDQLWAEAKAAFEAREQWWPSDELTPDIREEQSARHAGDEWESTIAAWVELKVRSGFSVGDVLQSCLAIEPGKWTRADQTRVGLCLKMLGYAHRRERDATGKQEKRYYPDQKQLSIPGSE